MSRKTVTIQLPDDIAPRDFHLHDHQVAGFVAKIEAQGGSATVGPLNLGFDLKAMLAGCGVNPEDVR